MLLHLLRLFAGGVYGWVLGPAKKAGDLSGDIKMHAVQSKGDSGCLVSRVNDLPKIAGKAA